MRLDRTVWGWSERVAAGGSQSWASSASLSPRFYERSWAVAGPARNDLFLGPKLTVRSVRRMVAVRVSETTIRWDERKAEPLRMGSQPHLLDRQGHAR